MAKRSKIVDRVAEVVNGDRRKLVEGKAESPSDPKPTPSTASLEQRMMKNLALIRGYEAEGGEHGAATDISVNPAE